jgi:hypothetical protein
MTAAATQRTRSDKLKAAGLCVRHSKEKSIPGMTLCQVCREQQRHAKLHLKSHYGITTEDYYTMLAAQGGRCANPGCRTDVPGGRGSFHVDHNHATTKVRGLLCNNCNAALGMVRESITVLDGLKSYLGRHSMEGAGESYSLPSVKADGLTQ